MNSHTPLPAGSASRSHKLGFSLIITVTLLILLSLISVGLLGLSSTTLRSASLNSSEMEARSNAKLGLMMALAELQKTMGPDQAISAPSNIVDPSSEDTSDDVGKYTGTWIARGDPRGESLLENAPASHEDDVLGEAPDYESSDSFKRWLVSNQDFEALEDEDFFITSSLTNPIQLVGPGSAGQNPDLYVTAGRITIDTDNRNDAGSRSRLEEEEEETNVANFQDRERFNKNKSGGAYAWWVSENGTKAYVRADDEKAREGLSNADILVRSGIPGVSGIEAITELDIKSNTEQSARIASFETLSLAETNSGGKVDPQLLKQYFHDLTTDSKSLLVNVTTGNLKKDLSLFFEGEPMEGDWLGSVKEDDAPEGPYGSDSLSSWEQGLSEPWQGYDTGHWKSLREHYMLAKNLGSYETLNNEISDSNFSLQAVDDYDPPNGFQHPYPRWNRQRKLITPVLIRMSYILSVGLENTRSSRLRSSRTRASVPSLLREWNARNASYMITFHSYPIATLWNPYNVPLECPGFAVGGLGMSISHEVSIEGFTSTTSSSSREFQWMDVKNHSNAASDTGNSESDLILYGLNIPDSFTLEPGEIKTFFAQTSNSRDYYTATPGGTLETTFRGATESSVTGVSFDHTDTSEFSAGFEKNSIAGVNSYLDNLSSLYGLFVNRNDRVFVTSKLFQPRGSKNVGSSKNYNGLMYYGVYSSLDIRTVTRSFGGFSGRNSQSPLHWDNWGGSGQASARSSSKLSNKIGWRNEVGGPLGNPNIETAFNASELTGGMKQPFLVVDIRLKSTERNREELNPNITWLHNIPGFPYAGCTGQSETGVSVQGAGNEVTATHAHPYTVLYQRATGASDALDKLQIAANDGELRSFMGNSYEAGGQNKAIAMEIPLVPLQSIAQLQHVPQVPIDATRWSGLSKQNYAIGNSFATPHLESDEIIRNGWMVWLDNRIDNADSRTGMESDLDGESWFRTVNGGGPASEHFKPTNHVDRSYVANSLLWDDFFFSGIADYNNEQYQSLGGESKEKEELASDFYSGSESLPNFRLKPVLGNKTPEEISAEISEPNFFEEVAAHLEMEGGFNVNSTSIEAWKAFISSNLKKEQLLVSDSGRLAQPEVNDVENYIISRFSLANGSSHRGEEDSDWSGYRALSSTDIEDLAEQIVLEVKKRGPFRSVAEFINRQLVRDDVELAVKGPLQTALDKSSVNESLASDTISETEIRRTDYQFEEAALQSRHAGSPPYVLQGDLLQSIGSLIQVRSDTFTVRAYGESSDGQSKAWCEAVVQRKIDWIDPIESPETEYSELTSDANRNYGRRFIVSSFRWLSKESV